MLIYVLKRLGLAALVVVAVSILTFLLLRLSGDPAISMAGEGATAADITQIRQTMGFDHPLGVQYLAWAGRAITGDFGRSFFLNAEVGPVVMAHLPVTATLGCLSLAFAILLSLPLGILAAVYSNTWIDRLTLSLAVAGQAMPTFWLALILIIYFGVTWQLLPISGNSSIVHFVLPAVALGYSATPALMRLTRAGMLEVLSTDYIRTARAKGLRWPSILLKHALRNAVVPVVSLAATQLGYMFGGSVVIETIFSMNGLGSLAWESILRSDTEVLQAIVIVVASIYIILTLLADLANAILDPRLRTH